MVNNRENLIQLINFLYRKHNGIVGEKISDASLNVADNNQLLNHLKSIWQKIGNKTVLSQSVSWHYTSSWIRGVILWVNETEIRKLIEFSSDSLYRSLTDMTHPHTPSKLTSFAKSANII